MIEETIRIKIDAEGKETAEETLKALDALEQKAKALNIIPEGFKVPDIAKKLLPASATFRKNMAEAAKFVEAIPAHALKPYADTESRLARLTGSTEKAVKLTEALRRAIPEAPPRMSALLPPGTDWENFFATPPAERLTGGKHVGYESPTFKDETWEAVKGDKPKKEKTPPMPSMALDPKYTGPYEQIVGKPSPLARSRLPKGLGSGILALSITSAVGSAINKYAPGLKGTASKYFGKGEAGKHFGEFALGTVPGGVYAMARVFIDEMKKDKITWPPPPPVEWGPRPAKNKLIELPVTPDYAVSYKNHFGKTNANIPDQEKFAKLPGIGPTTANKMVEYLKQDKQFKKEADLTRIHGIGPAKAKEMDPFLTFEKNARQARGFRFSPPSQPLQPAPAQGDPGARGILGKPGNTYHITIHKIADKVETQNFDKNSLLRLLGKVVEEELPY